MREVRRRDVRDAGWVAGREESLWKNGDGGCRSSERGMEKSRTWL